MHILNGNFGVVARGNSLLHCHPQIQIDYEISAIRFIAEIHVALYKNLPTKKA